MCNTNQQNSHKSLSRDEKFSPLSQLKLTYNFTERERERKLLPYNTINQVFSYQISLNNNDVLLIHLPFKLVLANQILWFY